MAKKGLAVSDIKVGSVFSFPYGDVSTEIKLQEVKQLIKMGADVIDGPINFPFFKSGKLDYIKREIEEIVNVARREREDIEIKFIIEAGSLTNDEIVNITKIIKDYGADYVKTTSLYGCNTDQVKLIRQTVGPKFGVKAGAREIFGALSMIKAGANRLGVGAYGMNIIENYEILKSTSK